MTLRITAVIGRTLFALAVVLFFAAYGYHTHNPDPFGGPSVYVPPSVGQSLHRAWVTLADTFHSRNLLAMYWSVSWGDIWLSLRLIAVATALAMLVGCALTVVQMRSRWAPVRQTIEVICGWLEAVPEAMYVVITVVVTLYIVLDLGVMLPIFPEHAPSFAQTLVPAVALGLPAGLYVWRALTFQIGDELSADYIRTALSKGASRRRVFYRHVLPNTWPALRRGFQGAAGIVLSTVLFAEFYMSYQGALFRFTDAMGWNMDFGTVGEQKLVGVPSYQTGLVFELTAFLVICGALVTVVSEFHWGPTAVGRSRYAAPRGPIRRGWLWVGAVMLLAVLVPGTFPHLFTAASPSKMHLFNLAHPDGPPFAPSGAHPLGTDGFGRDILARTLYATWPTLLPAALITLCSVLIGCIVAALAVGTQRRWLSGGAWWLSQAAASLPVLPLVFLALYDRNWQAPSDVQAMQYIGWMVLFAAGRSSAAFRGAMTEWAQFGFMEGVQSVGRSRMSALWTHLRSWLAHFSLEYGFSEFARVLSLMTLLAAFHIYVVQRVGFEQFLGSPLRGFVSGQVSWMQMIGDTTNNMAYATYTYLLYGPVLALLLTAMGANFIAKGLRTARANPW